MTYEEERQMIALNESLARAEARERAAVELASSRYGTDDVEIIGRESGEYETLPSCESRGRRLLDRSSRLDRRRRRRARALTSDPTT